jgi:hypothetical protein
MKRTFGVMACFLLLAACATSYRPYSFLGGGGWREVQLADNTFKVTFEANGYTSDTEATDMALLRSADLTLANGFKYFVIGIASDDSRMGSFTTPTTTNVNLTSYGNTTTGTAQTHGGQTFLFSFPAPSLTFTCFSERPSLQTTFYDAGLISMSMRKTYGIRPL